MLVASQSNSAAKEYIMETVEPHMTMFIVPTRVRRIWYYWRKPDFLVQLNKRKYIGATDNVVWSWCPCRTLVLITLAFYFGNIF